MDLELNREDALIVIDPQNDFVPGGKLAVAKGDEIMKPIVKLAAQFHAAGALVAITQDWHPEKHKSFASTWYMDEFSDIDMPYGKQKLWPDHCVQGTEGADLHHDVLDAEDFASIVIRKGMNPEIDSYSAFTENDQETTTGLAAYLHSKGITRVFVVGLAYDYCVGFSALDAVKAGFETVVLKDLTRAITADGATSMDKQLADVGATIIETVNA